MKLPLTFTGAACATALLISHTLEAAPQHAGADRFPITVEAFDARRAELFARIDADGDGLISAEEFSDHKPRGKRGPGQGKHSGSQGERTRPTDEQIAAMEDSLFERLDADQDGVLSRDEFDTSAMRSARKGGMKDGLFARADSNGDGYLSADEFPPGPAAALDLNGDGEISRDELRAARPRDNG